ncbi:MAG: exodeoxyribonuclease VII large subunit [Acholeplasmataceae bacterium]|nr:exodeoxyribonuclease VII large subunit [Acholeplasmataceae bacterium]
MDQTKQYLSVTALTKYIKYKLEGDTHLKQIYLKGEISNLTKHSRGHYYFSLKDENAQIKAIMFSSATKSLAFDPKDGDKVLAYGAISVYEPSGSYSIQIYQMEPDGIGALYLAYEKLKEELEEKGYFSQTRKKPIPKYPSAIGVITSPTGAAIRDIIHTIERRYPLTKLILYPALVQGDTAKESIRDQINKANQDSLVDVLIVGRGGGSIEDLWAFNERVVAEAIYASKIPIISAVGHETDFTISDFVSDLRAPTPTAAAELATPDKNTLMRTVETTKETLNSRISTIFKDKELALTYLDQRLDQKSPFEKLKEAFKRYEKIIYDLNRNYQLVWLDKNQQYTKQDEYLSKVDLNRMIRDKTDQLSDLSLKLDKTYLDVVSLKTQSLNLLIKALEHQNPLKLMAQGYTITEFEGKKLTKIEEVKLDDTISTRLSDGRIISKVIKKECL